MIMAIVLRSVLFSSIVLLTAALAPSSPQLPPAELPGSPPRTPPAPSSAAEPLGSPQQNPLAPSSLAELLGSTARTPPAPSPGALSGGYAERAWSLEFDERDVEVNGLSIGLSGNQKAGMVMMVIGGSGLLVYGGWTLYEKLRSGSSRRRRYGPLGQPRKFLMG